MESQCKGCGSSAWGLILTQTGGYCEGCEWISIAEAEARLGLNWRTIHRNIKAERDRFGTGTFSSKAVDVALLCIVFSLVVISVWRLRYSIADDAFIYLRISDNLASGHGWVFNYGLRSNAATSPFYAILLAFIAALHLPGITTPLLVATSVGICTLSAAIYFGTRDLGRWSAALMALGCSILPSILSTVGLEMSTYLACVALTCLAYKNRQHVLIGIFSGLTVLGRPEGLIILPIVAAVAYFRRTPLPWKTLGVFFLVIAPWCVFALYRFRTVIPHTLRIKALQSGLGWWPGSWFMNFVAQLYIGHLPVWFFLVMLVIAVVGFSLAIADYRDHPFLAMFFVFGSVQVAGYSAMKAPTGYFWYYAPGDVIYTLSVLYLFIRLVRVGSTASLRFSSLIYCLGMTALTLGYSYGVLIEFPPNSAAYRDSDSYKSVALWLKQNSNPGDWVACDEIGYLGVYSQGNIRDMLGLLEPKAIVPLSNRRWDWWFTDDPPPRFIVTHSPRWIGEPGFGSPPWPSESERTFENNYREVFATGRVQVFQRK